MGMKAKLALLFYISGLTHHLYTYYYAQNHVDYSKTTDVRILNIKRFHNRFLTSWNMGLQTLYLLIAAIFEIILLQKHNVAPHIVEKFSKIRGFLFTTLVFPSTMVVAFFFWLFYHLNSEYVIPNGFEEMVPSWVNHSIHTNIILLPIIELTLQKMWIPSMKAALIGLTMYSQFYNSFFIFTYFESGNWLYPLYELLSWPQRIALMELKYTMGVLMCLLGIFIQRMKRNNCDITKAEVKNKVAKVTKKLL